MYSSKLCVVSAALICSGLLLPGCRPDAQISQYEVPKASSIQLPLPEGMTAETTTPAASTAGRPERMLGAMVAEGGQFWFFKLTGPVEAVTSQVETLKAFLQSVKFVKGEPTWTLPTDWKQEPGSGIRFATIKTNTTPPLDLTVIALPVLEGEVQPQILANINRWRGQLSLPPIEADQLAAESQTLTTPDNLALTYVDYTGTSKGGGMMNAPFAQGMGAPGLGSANPPAAPATASSAVKYETPEGWREGRVGGLRKAALEIGSGAQKAEITVIDLPTEAGERLPNINRWRGQVGLEEFDAAKLAEAMQSLPIGDLKGDYVELVGSEQTILGVIVNQGDKAWFIKLQGPKDVAAAEKAHFEAFAKSVRFE